ncbi:hypothetical protein AK812_SmicGene14474 [Symbiodinium microadriaticum]|uniref:Secreted protein n=1 Tax=Symbiodinium microadriaticum TaxID=2951 RepID=A0A1Q9E5D2_SYMMI|nr:hypothetical protein AK812_SmicGene14474 [Symbiodinium microadriaticum]
MAMVTVTVRVMVMVIVNRLLNNCFNTAITACGNAAAWEAAAAARFCRYLQHRNERLRSEAAIDNGVVLAFGG